MESKSNNLEDPSFLRQINTLAAVRVVRDVLYGKVRVSRRFEVYTPTRSVGWMCDRRGM